MFSSLQDKCDLKCQNELFLWYYFSQYWYCLTKFWRNDWQARSQNFKSNSKKKKKMAQPSSFQKFWKILLFSTLHRDCSVTVLYHCSVSKVNHDLVFSTALLTGRKIQPWLDLDGRKYGPLDFSTYLHTAIVEQVLKSHDPFHSTDDNGASSYHPTIQRSSL